MGKKATLISRIVIVALIVGSLVFVAHKINQVAYKFNQVFRVRTMHKSLDRLDRITPDENIPARIKVRHWRMFEEKYGKKRDTPVFVRSKPNMDEESIRSMGDYRRSVIKRVPASEVNFEEFKGFVERFVSIVSQSWQGDTYVKVIIDRYPQKIVGPRTPELLKAQRGENMREIEYSQLTAEIFENARSVEVIIKPVNKELAPRAAFCSVDFHRWMSRYIFFYAQTEEVGLVAKDMFYQPGDPPNLKWAVGDGYEDL